MQVNLYNVHKVVVVLYFFCCFLPCRRVNQLTVSSVILSLVSDASEKLHSNCNTPSFRSSTVHSRIRRPVSDFCWSV